MLSFSKIAVIKIITGIVFMVATTGAHASDLKGIWVTEKSDTGSSMAVEIFDCDDKLCGKAVDVFDAPNRDSVGLEIIKGMQMKTDTSYTKGQIYAPDTKKWYKSKMSLQDDGSLKVSGCLLGGLICRSQNWTRQP